MTGIDDLEEVAHTIVNQRVNTLLGMPFYLNNLFTQQADVLRAYKGVKKIFYGGEHMNAQLRQRLTEEFGVELIRAGAYGSNDAGPLGYQCPHCVGNVYHVLSQTQYLEIVDQEEDRPVAPGEAGRLIFTSLARRGQKVARYEIGDMGRWVTEPCPCSRQSPRFELLGRTGDLFRAPNFFNYQTFCRVLADHAGSPAPCNFSSATPAGTIRSGCCWRQKAAWPRQACGNCCSIITRTCASSSMK